MVGTEESDNNHLDIKFYTDTWFSSDNGVDEKIYHYSFWKCNANQTAMRCMNSLKVWHKSLGYLKWNDPLIALYIWYTQT